MSLDRHRSTFCKLVVISCGVGLGVFAFRKFRLVDKWKAFRRAIPDVHVISNAGDCERIVRLLALETTQKRVLGFDCEWVTVDGNRRPVALLQLSSHSGLTALIRLSHLKHVPAEIRQLLEDERILKLGISPSDDARYLRQDYQVDMRGTLDLRFLARFLKLPTEGLAKMAMEHVGIKLDKNWRIRCSAWDAQELSEAQVKYAANDSFVAVKIFEKFYSVYRKSNPKANLDAFVAMADSYKNMSFKFSNSSSSCRGNKKPLAPIDTQKRNFATRSKPLYDNCFMEAPDGELLCMMDRNKAEWYRGKGLAILICEDPIRMRLLFEPSGRAVGESGQYYSTPKTNQCVVCGTTENCSRKFVVPKEYRKFFPTIMKSHSSHDILLLCLSCHRSSSMEDNTLRDQLAVMCRAPLTRHFKKLKKYAKSILDHRHDDPPNPGIAIPSEFAIFYPDVDITEDMLKELLEAGYNLTTNHAQIVTDHFMKDPTTGGLLGLEKMWREHFIASMRPKFLPDFWSTVHNANRLEIRLDEGRISEEDLLLSGLDATPQRNNVQIDGDE